MRKIDHGSVPNSLRGEQFDRARREIEDFLRLPEEQRTTRRAPIDEKLLQARTIYDALDQVCHGKCAYCETTRGARLGVDHHRPTSNAGGGRGAFPHHYAWLAFEWRNLLLVCDACSRRKRNQFPLDRSRAPLLAPFPRVRAHESPKLVDPGYDPPERHFDFTLEGVSHRRTRRGQATIELLDLNRGDLVEERRVAFSNFADSVRNAGTYELERVLLEVDEQGRSHPGSLLILRYRLLSELAERTGHYSFSFADAGALIGSVLERASLDQIAAALRTLEKPLTADAATASPPIRPGMGFTPPIRRIAIENFKAIDSIAIEMAPGGETSRAAAGLMLLGENATGKTSVLEAVTLALAGADAANKLTKARDYVPDPERGGHRAPYGALSVQIEFWEGPPATLTVGDDGKFAGTPQPSANVLAYGSRRYFIPGRRARKRSGGPKGLFDPGWPLPHPELWLKQLGPARFPDIARALGEILVLPKSSFLKRDEERGVIIVDGENETPLARHSDGYRSTFATAVDMLSGLMGGTDVLDAEGVVLIDEVETHLHPRWKMRVMAALRRALPRVQFIVTTHDPLTLRGMGRGEVQVMARDAENRIHLVPDLPDVAGMRIDQILTSEHFGMHSTLDPDFQEKFDEYYRLLREQPKSKDAQERIAILREEINQRQQVGLTERERLLLEAIDRFLADRALAKPERDKQDAALESELRTIWADARAASA